VHLHQHEQAPTDYEQRNGYRSYHGCSCACRLTCSSNMRDSPEHSFFALSNNFFLAVSSLDINDNSISPMMCCR
jgi:hypothetical protein